MTSFTRRSHVPGAKRVFFTANVFFADSIARRSSKLAPFVGKARGFRYRTPSCISEEMEISMDGSYKPRRSGCLRRRQRGVAAVEFGLVAMLFFTVLFSIIDWSYLFFANLSMQHAVREGARYAVVGRSDLAPEDRPGDRCAAVREKIRQQSWGLYERANSTTTFKTIDGSGNIVTLGGSSCYGAGQLIVVEVDSRVAALTPFVRPFFNTTGGEYRFTVAATMKNEAWQ